MMLARALLSHQTMRSVVTLVSVVIGCIATTFLFEDLREMAGFRTAKRVGEIHSVVGSAQYRIPRSVQWQRVKPRLSLHVKDRIRVSPESVVQIKLENGYTLEIRENSSVTLEQTNDPADQEMRGTMIVRGADDERLVHSNSKGRTVVQKFPFRLNEPTSFQQFLTDKPSKSVAVKFSWQGIGASEAVVEVSDSRNFARILASGAVRPSGHVEIEVPDDRGLYFWRIASRGVPYSVSRPFRISHLRRIVHKIR